MIELLYYVVHRETDPIPGIEHMGRSAEAAWQRYLEVTDQGRDLERAARRVASLEGVRCWCYRLSCAGAPPRLGFY